MYMTISTIYLSYYHHLRCRPGAPTLSSDLAFAGRHMSPGQTEKSHGSPVKNQRNPRKIHEKPEKSHKIPRKSGHFSG